MKILLLLGLWNTSLAILILLYHKLCVSVGTYKCNKLCKDMHKGENLWGLWLESVQKFFFTEQTSCRLSKIEKLS